MTTPHLSSILRLESYISPFNSSFEEVFTLLQGGGGGHPYTPGVLVSEDTNCVVSAVILNKRVPWTSLVRPVRCVRADCALLWGVGL